MIDVQELLDGWDAGKCTGRYVLKELQTLNGKGSFAERILQNLQKTEEDEIKNDNNENRPEAGFV